MTKVTKETSLLYNQLWINKAIEEGHYNLLPCTAHNTCIGEYIEKQYERLVITGQTPKITKKDSIIFNREWVLKAIDEGMTFTPGIASQFYSIGERLELKYFERELMKEINDPNRTLLLEGEQAVKKRVLSR